jgi:hypothetical protein
LANRNAALRQRVQPAVAAWITRQAKIESGRRAFDLNALRAAVRQRFATSLASAPGNRASLTVAQANMAIDALVQLVMMAVVNDADNDLNAMMQQIQAQTQAKQALRNFLDQVQQQEAAIAANSPGEFCASPFCQQLSSRLSALNNQFATPMNRGPVPNSIYFQPLKPAQLPPLPSVPSGRVSAAQLNAIRNQLQNDLDSMNGLSDMESMELQTMMDQRYRLRSGKIHERYQHGHRWQYQAVNPLRT